jgi:hypothetical protein
LFLHIFAERIEVYQTDNRTTGFSGERVRRPRHSRGRVKKSPASNNGSGSNERKPSNKKYTVFVVKTPEQSLRLLELLDAGKATVDFDGRIHLK